MESHRDLIIWTIKKFKELTPLMQDPNLSHLTSDKDGPLTAAEAEAKEKADRAKLAAERRAKILAEITCAQNKFMSSNAEMFNDPMDCDEEMHGFNIRLGEEGAAAYRSTACLGFRRRLQQLDDPKFKCILCFEDAVLQKDKPVLVYPAFIQKSKIIYPLIENKPVDNIEDCAPPSPHTSTCGHVMHGMCWKEYFDNEVLKENRRLNRTRPPKNFQAEKREFLCPYCRCLSNAVLPLIAPEPHQSIHKDEKEAMSFDNWLGVMHRFLNELYILEQKTVESAGVAFGSTLTESDFPNMSRILTHCGLEENKFTTLCHLKDNSEIDISMSTSPSEEHYTYFGQIFLDAIKRIAPYQHANEDCESFLIAWSSCSYTIQSIEMFLRATDKPTFKNGDEMSIRHSSCLRGLIRLSATLGNMITSHVATTLQIHLRGLMESILKQKGPSVVEWDSFSMLTHMIFMFPIIAFASEGRTVVINGSHLEYYLLKLMFMGCIVKGIVLFDNVEYMDDDNIDDEMDIDGSGIKNFLILSQFYSKYNLKYRSSESKEPIREKTVKSMFEFVKNSCMQFLRCSCLLFHFLTDVDFPEEMQTLEGNIILIFFPYNIAKSFIFYLLLS